MFEGRQICLRFGCYSNSQLSLDRDPRIRCTKNAIYQSFALFLIHESCGLFRVPVLFAKFPRNHGHARLPTN